MMRWSVGRLPGAQSRAARQDGLLREHLRSIVGKARARGPAPRQLRFPSAGPGSMPACTRARRHSIHVRTRPQPRRTSARHPQGGFHRNRPPCREITEIMRKLLGNYGHGARATGHAPCICWMPRGPPPVVIDFYICRGTRGPICLWVYVQPPCICNHFVVT